MWLLIVLTVFLFGRAIYFDSKLSVTDDSQPGVPPIPTLEFWSEAGDSAELLKNIGNASVLVPETSVTVTLSNGSAPYVDGDTRGTVTLGSLLGGHMTGGGDHDLFVELVVDSGGSGTFHYLALVHMSAPGTLRHTSSVFVGDRVRLQSAVPVSEEASEAYDLVVSYLDRAINEPFAAAPTMPKQLLVTIKNHVIEQ